MTKATQTANQVMVEAPRLTPGAAAVLATEVAGSAVSIDVVRRALREGTLKGRRHLGMWDMRRSDVIAWAGELAAKRRKA